MKSAVVTAINHKYTEMTQSLPRSVAILGGGISGLSSAYYLLDSAAKRGISLAKVYLLESQPRFGGYLQTASYGPNVDQHFELGPRTISTNSYAGTNAIALVFISFIFLLIQVKLTSLSGWKHWLS